MRILHVLNHTFHLSGNAHAAVDLACAQAELGHQVSIGSRGGSFDDVLTGAGVSIIVIDPKREPVSLARAAWRLYSHCREHRPDVIHAHMVTSCAIAWPVSRMLGFPLVATVHNEFDRYANVMGLADRVIAVSRVVRASMLRRGVPQEKLAIVLNGTIGSARLPYPAPAPASLQRPAVLFVGGLHPRKGVLDLIAAFAIIATLHPSAHLYLVGDGPSRAEYEAEVTARGLADRITFVGPVADPRPFLRGADIFVLASHADPAPLVISEAREAGCAIIATEVDGIPQLLDEGQAGILVPPRDIPRLAEAMARLLGSPEELSAQRSKSMSNLDNLKISRVAKETVAIYEDCIGAVRTSAKAAR